MERDLAFFWESWLKEMKYKPNSTNLSKKLKPQTLPWLINQTVQGWSRTWSRFSPSLSPHPGAFVCLNLWGSVPSMHIRLEGKKSFQRQLCLPGIHSHYDHTTKSWPRQDQSQRIRCSPESSVHGWWRGAPQRPQCKSRGKVLWRQFWVLLWNEMEEWVLRSQRTKWISTKHLEAVYLFLWCSKACLCGFSVHEDLFISSLFPMLLGYFCKPSQIPYLKPTRINGYFSIFYELSSDEKPYVFVLCGSIIM